MVADPTAVLSPKRLDLKQVRSRADKKCGRPAGNADSDSLNEKRKKQMEKRAEKEPTLHSALLSYSDIEVRHIHSK